jgi:hypothetical protein
MGSRVLLQSKGWDLVSCCSQKDGISCLIAVKVLFIARNEKRFRDSFEQAGTCGLKVYILVFCVFHYHEILLDVLISILN